MIRQIKGTVVSVEPAGAVVDVSGFGIFVSLPSSDVLREGEQVTLKTHMAVKQDGIDMYGFLDPEDLRFFELLLSVSGVGPKTALSIQRRAPRAALLGAIGKRDVNYLVSVVGLGKKAAEKLSIELSEKIGTDGQAPGDDDSEVFDTLVALGYTEKEARKALTNVASTVVGKDARLKAALSGKS